jgi:glycosyltransferase involved in cell wall biosynthesis
MTNPQPPHAFKSRAIPRRILMTVDGVGGIWRYAMDLAREFRESGVETVFAGFGPHPSNEMMWEAQAAGKLCWCAAPLDWMARKESELAPVADILSEIAAAHAVDLMHLNLPSQAAGLASDIPVVSVSHSCVVTWFEAVRGSDVPAGWSWHRKRNLAGFLASNVVIAPSHSHAAATRRCYGLDSIDVVHNASRYQSWISEKADFVFAAGRWWDEGKNGAALDKAAASSRWPIVMAGSAEGPNGERLPIYHADFRGSLDHAAAMALMECAAIFVSPSLYEPFGLAALEAARAGAVLVLADIPTYRELWGDMALYFDPRDPSDLASLLNALAASPLKRRDYGQRALLRSRNYTPARQADALLSIYARVLPSPVSATPLMEQDA